MSHETHPREYEHFVVAFVDDEIDFVGAVYDLLCGEYGTRHIAAFTDPLDADAWLAEHRPSVLVADVRMPGMNGIELVTRARRRWEGLPIIITTAYPSEVADRFIEERTFHYLPKPFSFQALLELLRTIQTPPAPHSLKSSGETVEILTLYAMAGYAGSLTAYAEGWPSAHVWLRGGRVLHACCGALVGLEALAAMLAMPRGVFDWMRDHEPAITIDLTLADALVLAFEVAESGNLTLPPAGEIDDLRARHMRSGAHATVSARLRERRSASFSTVDENSLVDAYPEVEVDLLAPTGNHPVVPTPEHDMANNIQEVLNELQNTEGFIAAAIADSSSGMALGKIGGSASFNVELAAAANTEVVKAKLRAMKSLKLDEGIEDILITLGSQYHLIRPLRKRPEVFFYVALDRRRANLAVARFALADAEEKVVI